MNFPLFLLALLSCLNFLGRSGKSRDLTVRRFTFPENCPDECFLLETGTSADGENLTRFCLPRNRHHSIRSYAKCRLPNLKRSPGTLCVASHCEDYDRSKCLRKYDSRRCKSILKNFLSHCNNVTITHTGDACGGGNLRGKRNKRWKRDELNGINNVSDDVSGERLNEHNNDNDPVIGHSSTFSGSEDEADPDPMIDRILVQSFSSEPTLLDRRCRIYEKFLNGYCYFLKIHKFDIPGWRRENANFLTKLSEGSSESCQLSNALALAVESEEENRNVMEFLGSLVISVGPVILTSGIKSAGEGGQWRDWEIQVNEDLIDGDANLMFTNETNLYVINPYASSWEIKNETSLFAVKNGSEWVIMCKRLSTPESTQQRTMQEECHKHYAMSECYNSFNPVHVKYCCAVDEHGDLWFGCPGDTTVKTLQDGSECAWSCNENGMFLQGYPVCTEKIDCTTKFDNVIYSAPARRYATGPCPKRLHGQSTWYCGLNKTFMGLPNYDVCCNTSQICESVDIDFNIWRACPAKTVRKRVTCPPETLLTEAIVEWHCLPDGRFNGSSPDYSNCNRTAKACRKFDKYNRVWKAPAGGMARNFCPHFGVTGICLWNCKENGEFDGDEPDCSKCHPGWIDNLADKINNDTYYKDVMTLIENHTSVEDLTVGFSHVLNLTSACVDLFKKQNGKNKTAFDEFLIDYSKILKNVAGKPDMWSTFLTSRRQEYASQILQTTQNATFAYLTFQSGSGAPEYNAKLADFQSDGFDFFVVYNSSLSGSKFPLENDVKNNWRLEVTAVNESGADFAAMGLIMNHSLSHLMFPTGNNTDRKYMNGPVLTFTVATSRQGEAVLVPDVYVSVTFRHANKTRYPADKVIRRRLHEGEIPSGIVNSTSCQYFGPKGWSSDGCFVTRSTTEFTQCTCKHLSTIGLLMSVHHYEPDEALEMLSLVTSGITIVALALTLVVFFAFDSIKNERILIGVNLSACLLVGHFLQITVMDKRFFYIPDNLCAMCALLLHYAFTASFCWMFVEGCHLYRMLVLVFESNIEFRFIYLAIGYGTPFLVIAATEFVGFIFSEQPYGQDELCWLKTPNYIWAFNGPVVLMTSINLVILIMAMKLAIESKMRMEKSKFSNLRLWIKGWFSLSVLLGIPWLFGLAYSQYNKIFAYIFVILNGLQGFFIFMFRCVGNVQYKTAFLQKLKSLCGCSNEFDSYKKFESIKSGTKIFAITQSGTKSTGSDTDSSLANRNRKNLLKKFLPFAFLNKAKETFTEEESSSGIGLDYDAAVSSLGEGISKSRSTRSIHSDSTDSLRSGRHSLSEHDKIPELSYHMNHYSK